MLQQQYCSFVSWHQYGELSEFFLKSQSITMFQGEQGIMLITLQAAYEQMKKENAYLN